MDSNIAAASRKSDANKRKGIISVILTAAAAFLSIAARKLPGFAQWYSTHLYPLWVGSVGRLMGYLPFS